MPAYQNIDRSRHWGVEVALDLQLAYARFCAAEQTSYTYSRFEFVRDDEFGNNDLPGAPRHFTTAGLLWQHGSGFWLAPQVEWVASRWFVDSENQSSAGAYWLANLRAGYDHAPAASRCSSRGATSPTATTSRPWSWTRAMVVISSRATAAACLEAWNGAGNEARARRAGAAGLCVRGLRRAARARSSRAWPRAASSRTRARRTRRT